VAHAASFDLAATQMSHETSERLWAPGRDTTPGRASRWPVDGPPVLSSASTVVDRRDRDPVVQAGAHATVDPASRTTPPR
jgi:hypothetical protein